MSSNSQQQQPVIPPLKGKYYSLAVQARSNYILYVNEFRFRMRLSWVDVAVQIELIEQQLATTFTPTERDYLTDEFYDRYLYGINGKYCIKKICQSLLYWPVYKVIATEFWYDLKSDAQFLDVAMRSLAYHFKNSKDILAYLNNIPKRKMGEV